MFNPGTPGGSRLDLIPYLPADANVTWSIPVDLPPLVTSNTPTPPYQLSVFEKNTLAIVAETPSWNPPKLASDSAQTPLALFSEGLQLQGAALICAANGQQLQLAWLPSTPLDARYTLFIHIVDASGKIIAQQDERPFNDAYPSDFWLGGYAFQTVHSLPSLTTPFTIYIGWYMLASGVRLPVQGTTSGEFVLPPMGCTF